VRAVDTHVLVYAHRREVDVHEAAFETVRALAEGAAPWAVPWPCVYEFVSVVTNPKIWRAAATPPERAWQQVEAWRASPSVRFLHETEDFLALLTRLSSRPRVRGPVVHDARIAALCIAHGVDALLSRDRDFSMFPELVVVDPFAPK
jgi:hypothetical protein